jgi:hypothetical protein
VHLYYLPVYQEVMAKTRKNRKGIIIYYSRTIATTKKKIKNLGDGFNPVIFDHFIGKKHPIYKDILDVPIDPIYKDIIDIPNKSNGVPCIIGIGSLLSWNDFKEASNQIICGTGFIRKNMIAQRPLKIISVRGEKTRQNYLKYDIDCPPIYGDLGLLLRYVIPPPIACNKKYTIGFIPHYVDKKTPSIIKAKKNPNWTIIDIDQAFTVKKFVKEIHECNFILSSSLHGIIVADSYGIPAYHVELSDGVGGSWKFKDYYSSVKRKYKIIDVSSMNEEKIINQLTPYKVDFDFDGYYQYIKDELNKVA